MGRPELITSGLSCLIPSSVVETITVLSQLFSSSHPIAARLVINIDNRNNDYEY
jgi:hypothetical protein